MRKISLLPVFVMLLFIWSCNSGDEKNKEELKEEIRKELKTELKQESEQEDKSDSQTEDSQNEKPAKKESESDMKAADKQTGKTNDGGGKQAAFTAKEIKNAVFMGTEPFWDITFYDTYAEKNDMSGTKVKFYYLKNGNAGNHKLSEVIKPASTNSVTFEVTDESGGVAGDVSITRKACSDGMSENIYPYTFSLEWKTGGGWEGCGRIK
jgi:uncharacterized membrane protein